VDELTLKSGTCPKCGSPDVYTNRDLPKRGERMQLVVSSMIWYFLDTYVCINCGHFEEYVNDKEIKDASIIDKIRETWKKVN
jgi:predicted nucleic-acid-binding Zn-ribbon protein